MERTPPFLVVGFHAQAGFLPLLSTQTLTQRAESDLEAGGQSHVRSVDITAASSDPPPSSGSSLPAPHPQQKHQKTKTFC